MPRSRGKDDLKSTYDRIRKPIPPPQKVEKDHRHELQEKQAKREIEESFPESKEGP
jgi:hypothetical protein